MNTTNALRHILLIEPDTIQARLIAQAIATKDLMISIASGAQAAISAADGQRPDIVILELALPSHNGVEFLHEFRSYAEWTHIPVLVFSQQHIDDSSVFESLGNVTYLYKPTASLATLKAKLTDLLA